MEINMSLITVCISISLFFLGIVYTKRSIKKDRRHSENKKVYTNHIKESFEDKFDIAYKDLYNIDNRPTILNNEIDKAVREIRLDNIVSKSKKMQEDIIILKYENTQLTEDINYLKKENDELKTETKRNRQDIDRMMKLLKIKSEDNNTCKVIDMPQTV